MQTTKFLTTPINYVLAKLREEKQLTLGEFIQLNRLEVGQIIDLADENGYSFRLFVGNCTLHHTIANSSSNIGWPVNDPIMNWHVTQVLELELGPIEKN